MRDQRPQATRDQLRQVGWRIHIEPGLLGAVDRWLGACSPCGVEVMRQAMSPVGERQQVGRGNQQQIRAVFAPVRRDHDGLRMRRRSSQRDHLAHSGASEQR